MCGLLRVLLTGLLSVDTRLQLEALGPTKYPRRERVLGRFGDWNSLLAKLDHRGEIWWPDGAINFYYRKSDRLFYFMCLWV